MNKELIKRYKAEFDHWLNGGKLQVKFVNDPWEEAPEGIFSYSTVNFVLVIDDEYIEFRKALAEGKTIQCNAKEGENDVTYTAYGHTWWTDTTKFKYATSFYRIKPEEPKFKVGDWVRDGENIYQFIEPSSIYSYESSLQRCEHWQPKPDEWCWYSKWDKIVCVEFYLCKYVLDMNEVEPEYKHKYEPFIGQLPTYLRK